MKVKLRIFYHTLSYKSAVGSGFLKGHHCYKQPMKVKLQIFYHTLSYKSAAGLGFLKV